MSAQELPHPLPNELAQFLSARLSLLGDETRIRILDQLRHGERNVQAIADELLTTQQNVSGHLRLLRAAGVVARRPAGREAYSAALNETVFEVWGRLVEGERRRM